MCSMNNSNEILTRRVEKVLPDNKGLSELLSQRKIRLYQGFDPTGGRLHLGHTIGLRKLMDFARAGHEVIFLFGTGTVLVGDPSQRDTGRKLITQEEIDENIKNWQSQVSPIVDFSKVQIRQNGDWLTKLTLKDLISIASNISAVQLFKREMFVRRIDRGDTVWYHETMYPLLQGYDSVAMDVDLEIGGTDQEFNMLIGRELQRKMNNREKFVLTVPMILGTDGQPMSKTRGNAVWLDDSAEDMYGKLMSIPDTQIKPYMELLTNIPMDEIENLPDSPLENKKRLALDITSQFHGPQKALEAQNHFQSTVQEGAVPEEIMVFQGQKGPHTYLEMLKKADLQLSNSEIKRLFEQGGVEVNNKKVTDPSEVYNFSGGEIFKIGKRTFRKLKV